MCFTVKEKSTMAEKLQYLFSKVYRSLKITHISLKANDGEKALFYTLIFQQLHSSSVVNISLLTTKTKHYTIEILDRNSV